MGNSKLFYALAEKEERKSSVMIWRKSIPD